MPAQNKHSHIATFARLLRRVMEEGIHLAPSSIDPIRSTGYDPSPERLQALLTQVEDDDTTVLMELFFFPEERTRIQLEGAIEEARFQPGDDLRVSARLMRDRPHARFYLPGERSPVTLAIPAWAAEAFVRRLNLERRVPSALRRIIDSRLSPPKALLLKVWLRGAVLPETTAAQTFLERFLTAASEEEAFSSPAAPLVQFVLAFLEEAGHCKDLRQALEKKRRFYARNIARTLQQQQQHNRLTMEMLAAQGVRRTFFDLDKASRSMQYIDRIGYLLYGTVPEPMVPSVTPREVTVALHPERKRP